MKEQQKRIGTAEVRNTSFSYALGEDGVEKFVTCLELRNDSRIGEDPREPGQVWGLSHGAAEDNPCLYHIEVNEGPDSDVRLLNKPTPTAFRESLSYAEQNL